MSAHLPTTVLLTQPLSSRVHAAVAARQGAGSQHDTQSLHLLHFLSPPPPALPRLKTPDLGWLAGDLRLSMYCHMMPHHKAM